MDSTKSPVCGACRMILVLAIFVSSATFTHAATVYKWLDEKGEVHYSDKVPAGKKWEIVDAAPVSVAPSAVPKAPISSPPSSMTDAAKDDQASADRALAERREKLLKECEKDRGVDCAAQVDTQLEAGRAQDAARVIHQAAPRPAAVPR